MNIAIIPARSGSKRILNKNTKLFFGFPIIYWSLKAAKESKIFDKIIVSTDSKRIAEIAKKYGAEIPFLRPKKYSNDKIGIEVFGRNFPTFSSLSSTIKEISSWFSFDTLYKREALVGAP